MKNLKNVLLILSIILMNSQIVAQSIDDFVGTWEGTFFVYGSSTEYPITIEINDDYHYEMINNPSNELVSEFSDSESQEILYNESANALTFKWLAYYATNDWFGISSTPYYWQFSFQVMSYDGDSLFISSGGNTMNLSMINLDDDQGEDDDDWDEEEEDNCYNEVFPGMDDIDMNTLFGGIEMTYQDIIFIVESSESTISILDENGINYVPEEVEGYLIFGPFTLEDIYTFFIEGLDDLEIDWGMFRPLNSEIISQGTYNTTNNSLPEIFNFSAMSIEDLDQELIIYSTDYYDLMGRKVVEPKPNSIYIELKSTNLGPLKEVKYYCN